MAYLIPTWELSVDNRTAMRNHCKEAIIRQFIKEYHCLASECRIRMLVPSDLGLESWHTPSCGSKQAVNWINHKGNHNQVAIIYKIVLLETMPKITSITISPYDGTMLFDLSQFYSLIPVLKKAKSTGELAILQVQYGLENLRMEGWFTETPVTKEGTDLIIDVISEVGCKIGDRLVLGGLVAEKWGEEIRIKGE